MNFIVPVLAAFASSAASSLFSKPEKPPAPPAISTEPTKEPEEQVERDSAKIRALQRQQSLTNRSSLLTNSDDNNSLLGG